MRKKSKLPILLAALLFGLAAAAEIATSRIVQMGGPEMAPQTPQRSERPGEAVAHALYTRTTV